MSQQNQIMRHHTDSLSSIIDGRHLRQRHAETLINSAYKAFVHREADTAGLSHFVKRHQTEPASNIISDIRHSYESSLLINPQQNFLQKPLDTRGSKTLGDIYYYVDHTALCPANTGLQRVVRMLAKALISLNFRIFFVKWSSSHRNLVFINAEERSHLSQWNGPSTQSEVFDSYPSGQIEGSALDQSKIPDNSWLLIPEVTHITYKSDLHTRDIINAAKALGILTAFLFYDAIPLRRSELKDSAGVHLDYMKSLVDADLVLPISKWSGEDLHRFTEIGHLNSSQSPSISVIRMPSESILGSRKRNTAEIACCAQRKILSVGSITPHKNQIALVQAFNRYCSKNPDSTWTLHLIGHVHPLVDEPLRALINSNPKVSHTHGATDDELLSAYETCAFTVFPSVEEGFGLPIVESLWFGRPCVCANFGAMAEAGDKPGCIRIDTTSVNEIEDAISTLIQNPDLLATLYSKVALLDLDTWEDYASNVVAALKQHQTQHQNTIRLSCKDASASHLHSRDAAKNRRIFWLGMHKILVQTELKRLRDLGFEVFNPPYLSDIADQSANLDWNSAQETTLPRDVFNKLASTNFFYENVDASVHNLLNEHFGTVLVTINPRWLETILEGYTGRVIYRVYGQSFSLSTEARNRGLESRITGNDQFIFMPHAPEAVDDEDAWLRANEDIVPYCLTDDIFGYQDSWVASNVTNGLVGLSCPNIANPYYRSHYDHLKSQYTRDYFRIYGVQMSDVEDPAVAGTLPRHQLIYEFSKMAAYIYTYDDPNVCYLPPIEAMTVGVPVVFVKGSLLDKYFSFQTPARCNSPEEAMLLTDRIKGGDSALTYEIIRLQADIRKRYAPSHVWPIFDSVIRSRIPCTL